MKDLYRVMLDAEQAEREAADMAAVRRAMAFAAADYFANQPFTDEKWAAMETAFEDWHTARDIAVEKHSASIAARDAWLCAVNPK